MNFTVGLKLKGKVNHVLVDAEDALKLDGKDIAVDELQSAIENLPPARKSTLVLKADEKASFGVIIKVMDALKLAGVKNLPAFTQTPPK